MQDLPGVSIPMTRRFVFLAEYKLTYADLDVDLNGGGKLSTEALTHHVNVGLGFNFGNLN
jgi:hypothetical protein